MKYKNDYNRQNCFSQKNKSRSIIIDSNFSNNNLYVCIKKLTFFTKDYKWLLFKFIYVFQRRKRPRDLSKVTVFKSHFYVYMQVLDLLLKELLIELPFGKHVINHCCKNCIDLHTNQPMDQIFNPFLNHFDIDSIGKITREMWRNKE